MTFLMVFKRFAFVTFKKRVLKVQNETSKNEIVNEAFTNNINKSFAKLKIKLGNTVFKAFQLICFKMKIRMAFAFGLM